MRVPSVPGVEAVVRCLISSRLSHQLQRSILSMLLLKNPLPAGIKCLQNRCYLTCREGF